MIWELRIETFKFIAIDKTWMYSNLKGFISFQANGYKNQASPEYKKLNASYMSANAADKLS
jgi:hypothetical protein